MLKLQCAHRPKPNNIYPTNVGLFWWVQPQPRPMVVWQRSCWKDEVAWHRDTDSCTVQYRWLRREWAGQLLCDFLDEYLLFLCRERSRICGRVHAQTPCFPKMVDLSMEGGWVSLPFYPTKSIQHRWRTACSLLDPFPSQFRSASRSLQSSKLLFPWLYRLSQTAPIACREPLDHGDHTCHRGRRSIF